MSAFLDLPVTAIEATAFASYGWLLGPQASGAAQGRLINAGSSLRLDATGVLQLLAEGGKPCLTLFSAQARDPRGPWHVLERHRLGTQTFIPLAGARCVVLVALGEERPDPGTLAAFLVDGHQAVTLHADTWHHGLIALDAGDFVVLERQGAQVDCDLATLPQPVRLLGLPLPIS